MLRPVFQLGASVPGLGEPGHAVPLAEHPPLRYHARYAAGLASDGTRYHPLRRQQHDPSAFLDPRVALTRPGQRLHRLPFLARRVIGAAVETFHILTVKS